MGLDDLDREIGAFLDSHGHPELLGAALSICGWERDGVFEMPNHSYRVERDWIRTRLNVTRVHLVNDIVAAALAIDLLDASELTTVSPGQADPNRPKALIALGRSLGTTIVTTDEFGAAMAQPCIGGHCDLPATNEREIAVMRYLIKTFGHVSRVRAVSTSGLVNVYRALHDADGLAPAEPTAQEIVALARQGDAYATEAVGLVLGWLAATASDTLLAAGARGGIFLAGSFFTLMGDLFDEAAFMARFTDKGRLSDVLKTAPVFVLAAAEPEMIGLSTLFA
jgi:glucokinase